MPACGLPQSMWDIRQKKKWGGGGGQQKQNTNKQKKNSKNSDCFVTAQSRDYNLGDPGAEILLRLSLRQVGGRAIIQRTRVHTHKQYKLGLRIGLESTQARHA